MQDKQYTRGKSLDTFAPCGPWITSMEEIPDVENLQLTTRINGQIRQNSSTKNMFIKIPSIISKLSKIMTLEKGDIIATGTPEGVALNNPDTPFLKDGDKIDNFKNYDISGSIESVIDNCDLVIDASPGGNGFVNKKNI